MIMPQQMNSLSERYFGAEDIQKNRDHGSLEDAQKMNDALSEAGNMLIGAWDRVFREDLEGHGRFVQTKVSKYFFCVLFYLQRQYLLLLSF